MIEASKSGDLILYGSARSPFVRKVRILLYEKGLAYNWCTDYYELLTDLNPLGKVPVLHTLTDGLIYDSPVICEYLELIAPSPRMIPLDSTDRLPVRQWEALADGICDAAVLIVNETSRKIVTERSNAWIVCQQEKIERSIAVACATLKSASYCHKNSFTLADAALCSALGYISFRLPHLDWRANFTKLSDYLGQMEVRNSISSTRPQ